MFHFFEVEEHEKYIKDEEKERELHHRHSDSNDDTRLNSETRGETRDCFQQRGSIGDGIKEDTNLLQHDDIMPTTKKDPCGISYSEESLSDLSKIEKISQVIRQVNQTLTHFKSGNPHPKNVSSLILNLRKHNHTEQLPPPFLGYSAQNQANGLENVSFSFLIKGMFVAAIIMTLYIIKLLRDTKKAHDTMTIKEDEPLTTATTYGSMQI